MSKRNPDALPRSRYRAYIESPEWIAKRGDILARDAYSCVACGASSSLLNVHHRTYATLGVERPHDLVTLCESCHVEVHRRHAETKTPGAYVVLGSVTGNYIGEVRASRGASKLSDYMKTAPMPANPVGAWPPPGAKMHPPTPAQVAKRAQRRAQRRTVSNLEQVVL